MYSDASYHFRSKIDMYTLIPLNTNDNDMTVQWTMTR